jgi:RsiW-degrading membrane proteinase PrsW (M82 family)
MNARGIPPDTECLTTAATAHASNRSARQRIRYHATYLLLAICVLGLAKLLTVDAQDHVVIPVLNLQLPETCASRQIIGYPCPGCGLTRGFIALLHGQWRQAWHYNPGVYSVLLLVIIQIPYRVVKIRCAQLGVSEKQFSRAGELLILATVFLLLCQWLLRLAL